MVTKREAPAKEPKVEKPQVDRGTLSDLLEERKAADQVYRLGIRLHNLHAVQGRNNGIAAYSWTPLDEVSDLTTQEGTPAGDKASPRSRRRASKREKTKQIDVYQFERPNSSQPPNWNKLGSRSWHGEILLDLGGPYGLFWKQLRDAVIAKQKEKYWLASCSLISFRTIRGVNERYVSMKAKTTVNSLDGREAGLPVPRMEPRNTRGKERVMVAVFHERLAEPVDVEVEMVVNSECPRNAEEVAGLLHGMEEIPCGPAKRGRMEIVSVERVQ